MVGWPTPFFIAWQGAPAYHRAMSKKEFQIVTAMTLVMGLLLAVQFFMAQSNQRLARELARSQEVINQARQYEPKLREIAVRVAQLSEKDPALRELLVKYELKVNLNQSGKAK